MVPAGAARKLRTVRSGRGSGCPEWGDKVTMQRGEETMSFVVGEAASEWCPGDEWSELATQLQLGEVAEFDRCGRVKLVSWTHVPREWVGEDVWKVVWRAGETPWKTPSAASDVFYRKSEIRSVDRPESGDDAFVEPDNWEELEIGEEHETWVESMGRGERSTFYSRGQRLMVAWDAELVDFVDREEIVDCTVRRLVTGTSHRRPGPLDTVRVRLDLDLRFPATSRAREAIGREPIVEQQLYDGDLDEAIATMCVGEIAEVRRRKGDQHRVAVVELVDFDSRDVSASDLRNAGNTAFERGDVSRALRRYNSALELGCQDVQTNRAACLIELGDFRNALEACDRALRRDPEDVQALRRKAKAHVCLGELYEARKPLVQCLTLDPENTTARREAAQLRIKLEARKDKMRRALAADFAAAGGTHDDRLESNKYSRTKDQLSFFDPDDDGAYLGLPNRPRRAKRILAALKSRSFLSSRDEKSDDYYAWLKCPEQQQRSPHEGEEEEDIEEAVLGKS